MKSTNELNASSKTELIREVKSLKKQIFKYEHDFIAFLDYKFNPYKTWNQEQEALLTARTERQLGFLQGIEIAKEMMRAFVNMRYRNEYEIESDLDKLREKYIKVFNN